MRQNALTEDEGGDGWRVVEREAESEPRVSRRLPWRNFDGISGLDSSVLLIEHCRHQTLCIAYKCTEPLPASFGNQRRVCSMDGLVL